MFQRLIGYFVRGLLIVVPVVATVYVFYLVLSTIDGWISVEALLGREIPGLGLLITVVVITVVGILASNLFTRWMFHSLDRTLGRLPLVKLIYTSLRDLTGAFVGEQKRFDKPVLVVPSDESNLMLVGFQTRENLTELGLPDFAAVYFPQSYNFAGNVVAVPRDRIRPLAQESAGFMTFIVSGGVSGMLKSPPPRKEPEP